ncbi:MAG: FtsX-like permease family protein [Bacteroidetes bacterium]|nr:MAG: FtsX-like permease family protein [Bacteroidota bacterium]
MLTFKLALKNLLGAGLRTWLNVAVLSFAFVLIIFYNGMIDGWNEQARRDTIEWDVGQGQLWHTDYDPYDPFTLQEAHGMAPAEAGLMPVLIVQATIYPEGRMMPVRLKGIPARQQTLALPTEALVPAGDETRIILGKRMAKSAGLAEGDRVLLRWRDQHGTFDAREVVIAQVFDTNVPNVDAGQVWIDLAVLQEMTGMPGEATMLVADQTYAGSAPEGWAFQTQDQLLTEIDTVIQSKKVGGSITYLMLLLIALLAIFDTQVLSIFRRQREIGTYIALGMTRREVIALFTVEGGANSLLAMAVGAVYGIPLMAWLAQAGIPMPAATDNVGLAVAEKIFPVYGLGLVLGTVALVTVAATIVSYMPARKIAYLRPTDALKGKIL